jgi:hypothetical protein
MLEIALIFVFSKSICRIAKSKGYKGVWFVLMFIAPGIVVGIVSTGVPIGASTGVRQEPPMLLVYVFGLMGAALGAATAFLIVNLVPPAQPKEGEEELEEGDDDVPALTPRPQLKDEGQYFDPEARRPPTSSA